MPARFDKLDVRTWPRNLRQAVNAIAFVFAEVYELARTRAAAHRSPIIRSMAQTDHAISSLSLERRVSDVLRRNREGVPARQRSHYSPHDRLEIILIMRLHGWSLEETSVCFAIHKNTIRTWIRELETDPNSTLFTGVTPFNKFGDAVRQLVTTIRALCPEREFGTRSIAASIVRAGIQLGRASVVRYLREMRVHSPCPMATPDATPDHRETKRTRRILRPDSINGTWHLDLTTFEFRRRSRCYVAAIVDGFSRKLLALRVYADAPNTDHVRRLLKDCTRQFGAPRFLVTDNGCQFKERFRVAAKTGIGIDVVTGTDAKRFNGKVERFFRTLKLWRRAKLLAFKLTSIQYQLNTYREWYNVKRPMALLGARTPEEAWSNTAAPATTPILATNPQPIVTVKRRRFRNDPHLFTLDIQFRKSA